MPLNPQHLFFCTNQRASDRDCCAKHRPEEGAAYMKSQLKAEENYGPGKIRVIKSGCLGRCAEGPCLVIFPLNVWYTYKNQSDLDEIRDKTLKTGEIIPRLQLAKIN